VSQRTECPIDTSLTKREAEVLDQIVKAASNKETAHHLGISERTVEAHRAHIMAKLNAKNTADLVRIVLAGHQL
jgi:two-component system, LuxR family, response regulator FixJ